MPMLVCRRTQVYADRWLGMRTHPNREQLVTMEVYAYLVEPLEFRIDAGCPTV